MKNKLLVERFQKLAGLKEEEYGDFMDKNYSGFKPDKEQEFVEFVNLVAPYVFNAGVDDPMMGEVDSWDTLFKFWEDYGDLLQHTQSDIIKLANEAGVSREDLTYILDLPAVSQLERG